MAAQARKAPKPKPAAEARKTPVLQYSIPCVAVQRQEGNVLIVNPFDTLTHIGAAGLPAQFVILDCWTNGVGVWRTHLTVSDPGGQELFRSNEVRFWLEAPVRRHQVENYVAVVLPEPGIYLVREYLDNVLTLEYRLKMDILSAPPAA